MQEQITDNRPIGMFDSGVGGLTVYKEIKKQMPNEKIIYLGDTEKFPYGSKSKQTIIELTKKNIDFLLKLDVKEIIIACGTATSQALDEVKKIYNIPIEGIIMPTVEYIAEKQNYKNIGIIATRGTIRSNAWENEIKAKRKDINIYNKECPLLAPMAEEGWTENEIARLTIKEYIKEFPKLDALILGCTHYPMFENVIKEYMPDVDIINTGKIIAQCLEKRLHRNKMLEPKEDEIYLTDTECNFINVATTILQKNIIIKKAEVDSNEK